MLMLIKIMIKLCGREKYYVMIRVANPPEKVASSLDDCLIGHDPVRALRSVIKCYNIVCLDRHDDWDVNEVQLGQFSAATRKSYLGRVVSITQLRNVNLPNEHR